MALPHNTGEILEFMGFKSGVDFNAVDKMDGNGPTIIWHSAQAQPDDATITAQGPVMAQAKADAAAAAPKLPAYADLVARVVALEAKAGITPPIPGA